MARRELDKYQTAYWQIAALLAEQPLYDPKVILEPCVGDGSIANVIREFYPHAVVVTNDVDPSVPADFHEDASTDILYRKVIAKLGAIDAVVTNPPYKMPLCTGIVGRGIEFARMVSAFMLSLSFREPTAHVNPRGPFLEAHPIDRVLTLPRHSFTGDGKSNNMTTEWDIWFTGQPDENLRPVLSLYRADERYNKTEFSPETMEVVR